MEPRTLLAGLFGLGLHGFSADNIALQLAEGESTSAITPLSFARLGPNVAIEKSLASDDLVYSINGNTLILTARESSTGIDIHALAFGDVNRDGYQTPIDALLIINHLNSQAQAYFARGDINGDRFNTPLDALLVINQLNRQGANSTPATLNVLAGYPEGITLGLDNGGSTVSEAVLTVSDVIGNSHSVPLSGITDQEQRWTIGLEQLQSVDLTKVSHLELKIQGAHSPGRLVVHGGEFALQPTLSMQSPVLTSNPQGYQLDITSNGRAISFDHDALLGLRVPVGDLAEGVNTYVIDHVAENGVQLNAAYQVTVDTVAPTGSLAINGGDEFTASRNVNLSLTGSDAVSGISQMRFSLDSGISWTAWEAFHATKAIELPAGEGQKRVQLQFQDLAGNVSSAIEDSIQLVPSITGSVVINGGNAFTTVRDVRLTINGASPIAELESMRFSFDDGTTWTEWEAYATSKELTLSAGDGTRKVLMELRNQAGAVSELAQDTISLDTVAPTGTLSIDVGAEFTSSLNIGLGLTGTDATSGVDQMRFSTDAGTTWSEWETFKTTKSLSLTTGDGQKTVQAELRDKAGLVSLILTDTITLDTIAPTGTLVINNNSEFTTTANVNLTITGNDAGSGLSQMRFSTNNGVTWSAWENFATTKAFTLTAPDGAKEINMQLRDRANLDSANIKNTITLDTVKPTGTISINNGNNYTGSSTVTLTLTGTDATSGLGQMRFSTDNGTIWSAWENYATTKNITLTAGEGTKQVTAELKDKAGLVSNPFVDTIIVDTSKPTGTVLINNGNQYTASPTVSLAITGADPQSGVTQMRFSTNNGATWSAWENYAASKSITLASGQGTQQVQMQLMNGASLISELITDTIILDNVGPTGSIVINGGAAQTTDRKVNVTLTGADAGSGLSKMTFSIHGGAAGTWFDVQDFESTKSIKLPQWDGVKQVLFKVIDKAGNESIFSDTIILEAEAPRIFVTSPAITNSPNYTLEYAVDGMKKIRQHTFPGDGEHKLTITETDPYGKITTITTTITVDSGLTFQPRAGIFSIDLDETILGSPDDYVLSREFSKKFLSRHEDVYDSVVFVPAPSAKEKINPISPGSSGIPPRNHVAGLGRRLFERRGEFGSSLSGALLQTSIINGHFLNRGETSEADPPPSPSANIFRTIFDYFTTHEILHYWLAAMSRNQNGSSNPLGILHARNNHWGAFFDGGNSSMYGTNWLDNLDGTFTVGHTGNDFWYVNTGSKHLFNDFDLYALGLLAPDEVSSSFVIDNPRTLDGRRVFQEEVSDRTIYALNLDGTKEQLDFKAGLKLKGDRREVKIKDIVDIEGMRFPNSVEDPYKNLSVAFILVHAPEAGEAERRFNLERLQAYTRDYKDVWSKGTDDRLSLSWTPSKVSEETGAEVEFTSPLASASSNYTLVYTVDGVEKREIVNLGSGKNVIVREATGTNGRRRVASFVVELVSGAAGFGSSSAFSSEVKGKPNESDTIADFALPIITAAGVSASQTRSLPAWSVNEGNHKIFAQQTVPHLELELTGTLARESSTRELASQNVRSVGKLPNRFHGQKPMLDMQLINDQLVEPLAIDVLQAYAHGNQKNL